MKSKTKIIKESEKVVATEISQRGVLAKPNIVPGTLQSSSESEMAFKTQNKIKKYDEEKKGENINLSDKTAKNIEKPYSNERVDRFMIDGISHDKHLMPENRNFVDKNNLVSKMETGVKQQINNGENRLIDQKSYFDNNKSILNQAFDSNNYTNTEFRGIQAHIYSDLHSYYTMNQGENSAVNLCSVEDNKNISLHSSLNSENSNSVKNAYEISTANLYTKVTGKNVYVTGDKPMDDPEIQKFLENKKVNYPENSDQKNFDYLIEDEIQGQKVVSFGDAKMRSLNHTTSNDVVSSDFNTNTEQIWSVGTASVETQKKVHTMVAQKAKDVCESQPETQDTIEKKAEITKYELNHDPTVLVKSKFVAKIVFNNDMNFKPSNNIEPIIPHNQIDEN